MKKLLILGGTYFIGRKLVETVLEYNEYEVYLLNRESRKTFENSRVISIIADREDPVQMRAALKKYKFDYIIDISGLNKKHVDILFDAVNTTQLRKMVFLSSSSVYRDTADGIVKDEAAALGKNVFWGAYGTDKIEAEKQYRFYAEKYGIECSIVRPPYVYGEYNYARRESFVFDHILSGKPIIVPGKNNLIQFIYVGDLAEILLALLKTDGNRVEIYNVGNTVGVTMLEWLILCGYVVKRKPRIYAYTENEFNGKEYFPFHDYDNVLDCSKIKKIMQDETDFIQGLKAAYHWYEENKGQIVFNPKMTETERYILTKKNDSIRIQ